MNISPACLLHFEMKRFVALVLLMLYTMSTIGLAVQLHICGGKFTYISVNHSLKSSSCCCDIEESCSDEPKDDKCCKNCEIINKPLDSQKTTSSSYLPVVTFNLIYSYIKSYNFEFFHSIVHSAFSDYSHAPPDPNSLKTPRFILLRSLLI